ncbi:glycosyltransferase [Rossellomorea sp. SC111]|uniref:glycosyltransferase n=1 Tax=Rossellomorea sp. SC111 TaxID=2968985 RepID=UPI00215A8C48|nr:glycosyltransferase [Rossellomorea sp. SC111]
MMNYVHTRNKYYASEGINFKVLSFDTDRSYIYDGIEVISEYDFHQLHSQNELDLIISHAPNLRNHLRFLKKKEVKYKKLLFFFHGHEVLIKSHYYPKPYNYVKRKPLNELTQLLYDHVKVKFLGSFFRERLKENHASLIFVSQWMKDAFMDNINIDRKLVDNNCYIIHNSLNKEFIETSYNFDSTKKADFITVRPFDQSKYAIDVVVKLAEENPQFTFHVYGKGDYFKHNLKPKNLEVFYEFFTPEQLSNLLDHYRCAIMPTRLDAQGVMMCEMAAYGIPVITSNLSICKEMVSDYGNTYFIDNDQAAINLEKIMGKFDKTTSPETLKKKFSSRNTYYREVEVIKEIINNKP